MILFYSKFESNIKNLISLIIPRVNKSLNNDIAKSPNNVNLNKKNKIITKKRTKRRNKNI